MRRKSLLVSSSDYTNLLVSSSNCDLDFLLILYLSNSTKIDEEEKAELGQTSLHVSSSDYTSLLVSSSDCNLDLLLFRCLSNSTKTSANSETAMRCLSRARRREAQRNKGGGDFDLLLAAFPVQPFLNLGRG